MWLIKSFVPTGLFICVHGEKMIFGKDNNRGLVLDGYN